MYKSLFAKNKVEFLNTAEYSRSSRDTQWINYYYYYTVFQKIDHQTNSGNFVKS